MFKNCISLTYINFTNFDSSKINRMDELFSGCTSLESIDLSSFSLSSITNMNDMFNSCINLKYINLKNAIKKTGFTFTKIFEGIPINIVFCFDKENVPSLYTEIKKKNCAIYYCSDNWKEIQLKIIDGTSTCDNNCSNHTSTLYELNNKCYSTCPDGYIGRVEINKCSCQNEKCFLCSQESLQNNLCISCNNYDGYYQKYEDNHQFIDCFKTIDGYFLEDKYFKPCYFTCEICNESGNYTYHHCKKCKQEYYIEMILEGFINCYNECTNNYYIDKQKNKHFVQKI